MADGFAFLYAEKQTPPGSDPEASRSCVVVTTKPKKKRSTKVAAAKKVAATPEVRVPWDDPSVAEGLLRRMREIEVLWCAVERNTSGIAQARALRMASILAEALDSNDAGDVPKKSLAELRNRQLAAARERLAAALRRLRKEQPELPWATIVLRHETQLIPGMAAAMFFASNLGTDIADGRDAQAYAAFRRSLRAEVIAHAERGFRNKTESGVAQELMILGLGRLGVRNPKLWLR